MCTFPSRPRVGPSSRPMYCANTRHGSTPRTTCTPMSRWSGVPTSFGAHRGRDADGRGLVPAAGVEGARDLPLLVEDVAALLDPARDQHVAVDAEEVLAVEACLLHLLERAHGLGFTYGHTAISRRPVDGSHSNELRRCPALGLQSRAGWRRPKRNWIQEERRKTLGDWVAFCLTLRHTLRYFLDDEDGASGGVLRSAAASCATAARPARRRSRRLSRSSARSAARACATPELFGTTDPPAGQ